MKEEVIKRIYKNKISSDSELALVKIEELYNKYDSIGLRLSLTHPKNGFYKSKKNVFLINKYDIKKLIEYFDNNEDFVKFYFIKGACNNENIHLYINKKVIKKLKFRLQFISNYFEIYISNIKDICFDEVTFKKNEKNISALKNIMKLIEIKKISFTQAYSIFDRKCLTKNDCIEMFGEDVYEREKLIYEIGGIDENN